MSNYWGFLIAAANFIVLCGSLVRYVTSQSSPRHKKKLSNLTISFYMHLSNGIPLLTMFGSEANLAALERIRIKCLLTGFALYISNSQLKRTMCSFILIHK